MESFLLTTTATSNPLIRRNWSHSSLPSSSSSSSILSSKVERRSKIRTVTTKTPSIVASVPKRGTGKGAAGVVVDGSVATVAADEIKEVSWKDVQYKAGSIGNRKPPPADIDKEKQMEYIVKILGSKVYDVAVETPLQLAPKLSKQLGINLWLKREDAQEVFSFKIRGAYNMISQLPKEQLEKGIICWSAGNHALGVALSSKRLKCTAHIVMPTTTPQIKIDEIESLGGVIDLYGDTFHEAQARAKQRSEEEGKTLIHPFDDEDIIAGQGTVGLEIARQMKDKPHAIFVPVGGGGLISGIASFFKCVHPEVKIFGVEPNDGNSMAQALFHDEIVNVTDIGHFANGVAVQQVGKETFRICREQVDDVILVDKELTSAVIKDVFNCEKSMLEPSGALAIAGAKAYCQHNNITGVNIVAITSGGNLNFDQLFDIFEHANTGLGLESALATILPEKPGSFKKFTHLLDTNIREMSYRYNSGKEAVVFYKVGAVGSELEDLVKRLESFKFKTYNLSDNRVAKNHLRYLNGGRPNLKHETLYHFTFPERQGALRDFFHDFHPSWNISLLHYRQQGVISSDVLVGVQMDKIHEKHFQNHARKVGYKFEVVPMEDAAHVIASL